MPRPRRSRSQHACLASRPLHHRRRPTDPGEPTARYQVAIVCCPRGRKLQPGGSGAIYALHASLAASGSLVEGGRGKESGRRGGRQQRSAVFLMHSQPNGECARRCLETEAFQLSFKRAQLCRGTRQVHTLTRLQAMAPIDGAPKFLSHELLWAPSAPAQRTKVGRAPLAPE